MAVVDVPVPRPLGVRPPEAAGADAGCGLANAGVVGVGCGHEVSLWIFDAGLACCAVEVTAALRQRPELTARRAQPARPAQPTRSARRAQPALEGPSGPDTEREPGADAPVNVMVVAGTVTDRLAPLVLRAYQNLPEPRRVLSFGACSNSGGPYWDSYCVTKGVDQMIPVDVYVPGCPPRPEALLHGLGVLLADAAEPS